MLKVMKSWISFGDFSLILEHTLLKDRRDFNRRFLGEQNPFSKSGGTAEAEALSSLVQSARGASVVVAKALFPQRIRVPGMRMTI